MSGTPRDPRAVALAALLLHAGLMAAYLAAPKFGGDASALVCVGRDRLGQPPFRHVRTGFPSGGYDGQAYYVIAQNPWTKHDPAFIDKPSYRHLRVLYPALGWLTSLGDPEALFWSLPAINLLAIAGLAGVGAWFAARLGRNAWWGLLLPLAVNAGMPALRDLTDPLASFTVFLFLVAWLRRWPAGWLALTCLLAVFAREQNLAVVGIVVLLAAWERDVRRVSVLTGVMILWAGWAALLWRMYDDSPFPLGNFGSPLAGFLKRWADPTGRSTALPIHTLGLSCLGVELLACLLLAPLYRPERTAQLVGWAGVTLAALGSSMIYDDVYAYLRVFPWVPLALWLWAAQSGRRWPFLLTLPLAPWPLLGVMQAWR